LQADKKKTDFLSFQLETEEGQWTQTGGVELATLPAKECLSILLFPRLKHPTFHPSRITAKEIAF